MVRSNKGVAEGNVFGGYTGSAAWQSSSTGSTQACGAFLFSLRNRHGRSIKLPCTDPANAICFHSLYAIRFGGGADLTLHGTSPQTRTGSYCNPKSYTTCDPSFFVTTVEDTLLAGSCRDWLVTEVEVFACS